MPTVTVNAVRLHYEQRGSGAPIVCIHGAGSSSALWLDALAKLGSLGRAIAYDRRGYGRSERPQPCDRIDVAQHTQDAAALLDALGAAPAIVIARSYGGEVATDLALRHPDRVRALVLLEAVPADLVPAAAAWTRALRDRLRDAAAHAGDDAIGEALIGAALGEGAWSSLPDEVRRVFKHNGPAALADLDRALGPLHALSWDVKLARFGARAWCRPAPRQARQDPGDETAHDADPGYTRRHVELEIFGWGSGHQGQRRNRRRRHGRRADRRRRPLGAQRRDPDGHALHAPAGLSASVTTGGGVEPRRQTRSQRGSRAR